MVRPVDTHDRSLLLALEKGLPLETRPYLALGKTCGLSEEEVMTRLAALRDKGTVSRFGVVVRHRKLGYKANAMVVWDVEDEAVALIGRKLAALPFVTLCYRRPRRLPLWPYNLFCMIHGREREEVLQQIEVASRHCGLQKVKRDVLFSRRAFKQRGARYDFGNGAEKEAAA